MLKKITIFLLLITGILVCSSVAHAGFGISPPYVKTSKPIFPGSQFEQKITLLRSSADDEMQAEITINAPEIESWINIRQGEVFDLPKDKLKVPMMVEVNVPDNAEIGDYKGYINIRIVPKKGVSGGGVAIALGARVDIELTITNETFIDFNVRKVEIPAFEELARPWSWKIFSMFFYRVKVLMNIENKGNVKTAPSKVHLDVYDISNKNLLASYEDTSIKKVEPFITKTVPASFATKLKAGQYWGKVKVYNENDIVYKDEIAFTIYSHGGLEGGTKLGIWPYLMMGGLILLNLIIILLLIKFKFWRFVFASLMIITWPLRYLWRKFLKQFAKIKKKFLRWVHEKSAGYKEKEDEPHKEKED